MIACGACARAMSVRYQSGQAIYDCATSRADHTNTPECRSVKAVMVDQAVVHRLLSVVSATELAVALAAADEVEDRRARSNRALQLRIERARYEAARAERAFHQCEPENRLVARSLEHRWEDKLKVLAEAESALTEAQATMIPIPPRAELEALASDLPRLWTASTTSDKDRKRLLRTLVADVTLRSAYNSEIVRIGIHWRSGAAEEVLVPRPAGRRTALGAIELVRRHRACRDEEIAAALITAGFSTGTGRPFDVAAVRWLRHVHKIQVPSPLAPEEVTVADVAATFGITEGVVYYWIKHGQLHARQDDRGRWCVPFSVEVKQTCRQWLVASSRIKPPILDHTAGGAV